MSLDDALGPIETRMCAACNENIPHSHGSREADLTAQRFRDEALASLDDERATRGWFFLSFSGEIEPRRFKRRKRHEATHRNRGCAYIYAPIVAGAPALQATRIGANPGGEVGIFGPLDPADIDEHVPIGYRNRLITNPDDYAVLGIVYRRDT